MTVHRLPPRYRLIERSYIRYDESGEHAHCHGPHDTSTAHNSLSYGPGASYDPDCSWCWLNAPHTVDAHNESLRQAAPVLQRMP
jgi:hypothetical protein